jgi:hypothetical protein
MSIKVVDGDTPFVFAPTHYPCAVCGAQPGQKCVQWDGGPSRYWCHDTRGPEREIEEPE